VKTFQWIDVAVQILISIICLAHHFSPLELIGYFGADAGGAFFIWLFALGGWQLISCGIHAAAGHKSRGRRVYQWLLLLALPMGCIPFYGWFALLVFGPVMGLFYFLICLTEVHRGTITASASQQP